MTEIIIWIVVGLLYVALLATVGLALRRLRREVTNLVNQTHDHPDATPEMSASEPHGEPPPAPRPPRHSEPPMALTVVRTDTAAQPRVGPADLPAVVTQDLVAPPTGPRPVRVQTLTARHRAETGQA